MEELLLTPERREKAAEVQAARRERFGQRVLTDPARVRFAWGVTRALVAAQQLQALQTSGGSVTLSAEQEQRLHDQLAEGKAAQGKFAEAAAICANPEAREEYKARAAAFENPGRHCACPERVLKRQPGNAKALEVETQSPIEEIWTGTEKVTLMRCSECETIWLHLPAQAQS